MPDANKEIIKAAKKGDVQRVKVLLATDAELVQARDTDGSTPLHRATCRSTARIDFLLPASLDIFLITVR